jgi:arginyl-tRNA synthetase
MASLSLSGLQALLHGVGVDDSIPTSDFPQVNVLINSIDIYRCYLAKFIAKIVGCDTQLAYDALQWTATLAKGDLVMVVPRLRLKGVQPNQLAIEIASKVLIVFSCYICSMLWSKC